MFWARKGGGEGGLGLLPYMGLSEVFTAPKGMVFEVSMSGKGVNFIHIGLILGVFSLWLGIEYFVHKEPIIFALTNL